MMTAERMHIGWRFWLQWVLASVVGFFLGLIVGWVAVYEVASPYGFMTFAAAPGAGVGIMQWLVVRRHVSGARWWALATMLGLGVTAVVGTAVLPGVYNLMSMPGPTAQRGWIIIMAVGGAMTGVMQWSILRRQFSKAGWWVLASAPGWALSLHADVTPFLVPILLGSVVWLAAVMGLALVWLLRQPAKEA